MNIKYLVLFFLPIHIFATCGDTTKQPERPMEAYDEIPVENEISIINIPIKINKVELQKKLNTLLVGDLYTDNNLKDDGLMVRASKREDIEIELHKDEIHYRVPLDLWVKKDLTLTSAEAEGELDMVFKTAYQIMPNWSLKTQTEVTGYDWIKKPVLKIGFAKLPVESIANIILERFKNDLTTAIDAQTKNSLELDKTLGSAWKKLHNPLELSREYNTWLLPNPLSVSLTPLSIDGDTVETTVGFKVNPQVYIGEKPSPQKITPLPSFAFSDEKKEDFKINLTTEIAFVEAERIAKLNLVGQTFEQGRQKVKITNIELYGQGNKLVIGTEMEGSYNGKIYLKGKPVFSEKKNQIELKDLDFDFSSKRFLLNSVSWLFKGKFKSVIQENIDFQLTNNMIEMKKTVENQLKSKPLGQGVILNGKLNDLAIQKVYLTTEAIRLTITLEGDLLVSMSE